MRNGIPTPHFGATPEKKDGSEDEASRLEALKVALSQRLSDSPPEIIEMFGIESPFPPIPGRQPNPEELRKTIRDVTQEAEDGSA